MNRMAYEYKNEISSLIIDNPSEIDGYAYDEIKEVYRKAKAFDEINKILDVYLGNVEDELNALNLIREKLEDMEDE